VEVARWQVEPEYALKIWPRGWRMQIAPFETRSQEPGVKLIGQGEDFTAGGYGPIRTP
jgi:hypothetical protein